MLKVNGKGEGCEDGLSIAYRNAGQTTVEFRRLHQHDPRRPQVRKKRPQSPANVAPQARAESRACADILVHGANHANVDDEAEADTATERASKLNSGWRGVVLVRLYVLLPSLADLQPRLPHRHGLAEIRVGVKSNRDEGLVSFLSGRYQVW